MVEIAGSLSDGERDRVSLCVEDKGKKCWRVRERECLRVGRMACVKEWVD